MGLLATLMLPFGRLGPLGGLALLAGPTLLGGRPLLAGVETEEIELLAPPRDVVGEELVFRWAHRAGTGLGGGGSEILGEGILVDVVLDDRDGPRGLRLEMDPSGKSAWLHCYEVREGRVYVPFDPARLDDERRLSPYDGLPPAPVRLDLDAGQPTRLRPTTSRPLAWGPLDPRGELPGWQRLEAPEAVLDLEADEWTPRPRWHQRVFTREFLNPRPVAVDDPRPDVHREQFVFDPRNGIVTEHVVRTRHNRESGWSFDFRRVRFAGRRTVPAPERALLRELWLALPEIQASMGSNPRRALQRLAELEGPNLAWSLALRELGRRALELDRLLTQLVQNRLARRGHPVRHEGPEYAACLHALFHGRLHHHALRLGLDVEDHRRAFEAHAERYFDPALARALFHWTERPASHRAPGFGERELDAFRQQLRRHTRALERSGPRFATEFDLPPPVGPALGSGSRALWEEAALFWR